MTSTKMTLQELKGKLRRIDRSKYPNLNSFNEKNIYNNKMGPGGLYLASKMCQSFDLRSESRILDLGCGWGTTSIYLASTFGARVFAVDLWISSTQIYDAISKRNLSNNIIPLNLDITKSIPFSEKYFDIIFCMDSIHYYGGNCDFLKSLAKHLKPNGIICIGSPCFSREFTNLELADLPTEYMEPWADEFAKYHSPKWWKSLFQETNEFQSVESNEIDDGVIMWEDELYYNIVNKIWFKPPNDYEGSLESWYEQEANKAYSQISYGFTNSPFLTHFILTAIRNNA